MFNVCMGKWLRLLVLKESIVKENLIKYYVMLIRWLL